MGIRSQNNPIAAYLDVFSRSGTDASTSGGGGGGGTGLTASGGVISEFTSGSDVYRAHIFTSSGIFDVTALSDGISDGDDIEYLVVAGGGSAGVNLGGGGGAGGLRTNVPGVTNSPGENLTAPTYTVSVAEYTVVVGGGGAS